MALMLSRLVVPAVRRRLLFELLEEIGVCFAC
jgi:hypothetical protein